MVRSSAFLLISTLWLLARTAAPALSPELAQIKRVVVIFQENQSFDGYFGLFPGANGIANSTVVQVAVNGTPYTTLPQPRDTYHGGGVDPRFPADLPNRPFNAELYIRPNETTGDLVHRFYQQLYQINHGKMDKFVAYSDAAGLALSYFDCTNLPLGLLARDYVLGDNMFHGTFGGSYLNHMFLVSATVPVWPNAPASLRINASAVPGPDAANSTLFRDGTVTEDGYVVNTAYTVNTPHPANKAAAELLPGQTATTIGDRLSEANVSWAWYSGGWNNAVAGNPDPLFQFHHQPFAYFANFANGTVGRAQHLKDEQEFYAAIDAGTLPQVSFVKALGIDNEHPGYSTILAGQNYVVDIVRRIQNSPAWKDVLIIITYDENGGRWDHVPPPVVDKWGPGVRVPLIIVSPFAKRGFIDRTQYDTTSVLKTIENLFGLHPLTDRDAAAS